MVPPMTTTTSTAMRVTGIIFVLSLVACIECAEKIKYVYHANSAQISTCSYSELNGVPIPPNNRVVGRQYVCTSTGAQLREEGRLSSTGDGVCQYYCPNTDRLTLNGITTFTGRDTMETTLLNPFVYEPPTDCIAVTYQCDAVINDRLPINELSIKLHGSPQLKNAVFGHGCTTTNHSRSTECAVAKLLHIIRNGGIPEDWMVTAVRGEYACLLGYIGSGRISIHSACWIQLGANCYKSFGKTELCINDRPKVAGITDFQNTPSDRKKNLRCFYDMEQAIAENADMKKPPPILKNCDEVILTGLRLERRDDKWVCELTASEKTTEWHRYLDILFFTSLFKTVILGFRKPITTEVFTEITASKATRGAFIKSCQDSIINHGFSGGIYLEIPPPRVDGLSRDNQINQALLLEELRATVPVTAKKFTIYAGVSMTYPDNTYYDIKAIAESSDLVFLNGYDLPGKPATRGTVGPTAWDIGTGCGIEGVECPNPTDYHFLKYGVSYYTSRVPPEKLSFGFPLWGRGSRKENGEWIPMGAIRSPQMKLAEKISYGDIRNNDIECIKSQQQMCCTNQVHLMGNPVAISWDNGETAVEKAARLSQDYGIMEFHTMSVNLDTVTGTSFHQALERYIHSPPPSSITTKTETLKPPTYQIGKGPLVHCPGIIAVAGDLVFTQHSYTAFSSLTTFTNLFVAKVTDLKTCVKGDPQGKLELVTTVPGGAVDLNTFLPTTSSGDYSVGLLNGRLVQFIPEVQESCQDTNSETVNRKPYVEVDETYYLSEPKITADGIMIPEGVHFFMTDEKLYVDYLNFATTCVNYKIENLPSCITVTCSSDPGCINRYAAICSEAESVIGDVRRSNKLILTAYDDLSLEHKKAKMFALQPTGVTRGKFILGTVALAAATAAVVQSSVALGLAVTTAQRLDTMIDQMETTREVIANFGETTAIVSSKLDKNTQMVNARLSETQTAINNRFTIMEHTFNQLSSELKDLSTTINEKFKVTVGYQVWYQQMLSLNTMLTQGAIQLSYKVGVVRDCFKSLMGGTMAGCPSGVTPFVEHPGLAYRKTVAAIVYEDEKLFIVNKLPSSFTAFNKARFIPTPREIGGEICWPDYDLSAADGEVHSSIECVGRYCDDPVPADAYNACLKNYTACKMICAPCFKGVCYDRESKSVTFKRGEVTVKLPVKTVPVFDKLPGTIAVEHLLDTFTVPTLPPYKNVSIAVTLESVEGDVRDMRDTLARYERDMGILRARGESSATLTKVLITIIIIILLIGIFALLYFLYRRKVATSGYARLNFPGDDAVHLLGKKRVNF
uniref:Structural envelope n=1 Tax=Latid herpesvirus 1 TaxID=3096545 RepID=A0AB33V6L8_9VIRU